MFESPVQDYKSAARALESLRQELSAFAGPQDHKLRITLSQFLELIELFRGVSDDPQAVATISVSLIYGDLCKMTGVKQELKRLINADSADHDIALHTAFQPENIKKCSTLFPTMFSLPTQYQQRIHGEVLSGLNLGHVLQAETGPTALTPLRRHIANDAEGIKYWLLPTLLDVLGARADAKKPETWAGSVLGNSQLTPELLTFSRELTNLSFQGEVAVFDAFQRNLSQESFYTPIFADPSLSQRQKDTIFRLSRFWSWKTDARPLEPLIAGFKGLSQEDQELMSAFFLSTGLAPGEPKIVVSYLPYTFTQLYSKHLELNQAISWGLESMCSLLRRIDEWKQSSSNQNARGIRNVSAQNVWFNHLRPMTKEQVQRGPLRFAIAESRGGVPEVIME